MTNTVLESISILVPVGVDDDSWRALHLQSKVLFPEAELIFAFAKLPSDLPAALRSLQCPQVGRAKQMNYAAGQSEKEFLWFLHADTVLSESTVKNLTKSMSDKPDALFYSNLYFQNDGPKLMWINSLGVWLRSHLLGMPFGDQGIVINRMAFLALGGYDENTAYGEDHLLVWAAKIKGIPVRCTGGWVSTSARKYQGHWGKVTLTHLAKTYRQAAPQFGKWIMQKGSSK